MKKRVGWLVVAYILCALIAGLYVPVKHSDVFDRLGFSPDAAYDHYTFVRDVGNDTVLRKAALLRNEGVLALCFGLVGLLMWPRISSRVLRMLRDSSTVQRRSICVWLGSITLSVILLFPPWVAVLHSPYGRTVQQSLGFSFLLSPPRGPTPEYQVSIRTEVLLLEVLVSLLPVSALYMTWARADRPRRNEYAAR